MNILKYFPFISFKVEKSDKTALYNYILFACFRDLVEQKDNPTSNTIYLNYNKNLT